MFKWNWKGFFFCKRRRRQQRTYLQEILLTLLQSKDARPTVYFLARLRQYDSGVFDPLVQKSFKRFIQIKDRPYSRERDRVRAFKQERRQFLEAVKYAL